jgi:hypothetical protein
LVLDETTEKKAGKSSYGLDLFFSSLAGKVIPSVSFLGASVVNVKSEQSHFFIPQKIALTIFLMTKSFSILLNYTLLISDKCRFGGHIVVYEEYFFLKKILFCSLSKINRAIWVASWR